MIYLIKKLSLSFDANVFDKLENLKEIYLTHSNNTLNRKVFALNFKPTKSTIVAKSN